MVNGFKCFILKATSCFNLDVGSVSQFVTLGLCSINMIYFIHFYEDTLHASLWMVSPDDVIVVSQVEPLTVLPGVVNHTHTCHKVHHLFAGSVVQVIPALVAPVPVDPVQPEPAARGPPLRHGHSSDGVSTHSALASSSLF